MEKTNILKPLKIGNLVAKRPVIQGGMGVGISLSSLAGAVAKAGGIGIISTAQIGFKDHDFGKNPMAANLRAIHSELKKAREKAPQGVLGFNIMVATKEYASYVKEAVKAGADVIISGAEERFPVCAQRSRSTCRNLSRRRRAKRTAEKKKSAAR